MVTDVSDICDALFVNPFAPSPTHDVNYVLSFDDLEFPFPVFSPVEHNYDVRDVEVSDELYENAMANLGQLFSGMSDGKSCQQGDASPRRSVRLDEKSDTSLTSPSARLQKARRGRPVGTPPWQPPRRQDEQRSSRSPVRGPTARRGRGRAPSRTTATRGGIRRRNRSPSSSSTVSVASSQRAKKRQRTASSTTRPNDSNTAQTSQSAEISTTDNDGDDTASQDSVFSFEARNDGPMLISEFMQRVLPTAEYTKVPNRDRILTDDELNVLWYYCTVRERHGNVLTPDYVLCLLAIASMEEQHQLLRMFVYQVCEHLKDDDHTLTAGHVRYKYNEQLALSQSALPPNFELQGRTLCFACKQQGPRSDRHRYCPPCQKASGAKLCPLESICRHCLLMSIEDLKARYDNCYEVIRTWKIGHNRKKRELPRHIAYQYDCNVLMVDQLAKEGKTADTIPAGLTRPAVSLAIWESLPTREVKLPTITPRESNQTSPFKSRRFGPRSETTGAAKKKADEINKLKALPDWESAPYRLTMTEVRAYHKDYAVDPGKKLRSTRRKLTDSFVREHTKATMSRQPYYERKQRSASPPRSIQNRETVRVTFAMPDEYFWRTRDSDTFVLPISANRSRLVFRHVDDRVTRGEIFDINPDWAYCHYRAQQQGQIDHDYVVENSAPIRPRHEVIISDDSDTDRCSIASVVDSESIKETPSEAVTTAPITVDNSTDDEGGEIITQSWSPSVYGNDSETASTAANDDDVASTMSTSAVTATNENDEAQAPNQGSAVSTTVMNETTQTLAPDEATLVATSVVQAVVGSMETREASPRLQHHDSISDDDGMTHDITSTSTETAADFYLENLAADVFNDTATAAAAATALSADTPSDMYDKLHAPTRHVDERAGILQQQRPIIRVVDQTTTRPPQVDFIPIDAPVSPAPVLLADDVNQLNQTVVSEFSTVTDNDSIRPTVQSIIDNLNTSATTSTSPSAEPDNDARDDVHDVSATSIELPRELYADVLSVAASESASYVTAVSDNVGTSENTADDIQAPTVGDNSTSNTSTAVASLSSLAAKAVAQGGPSMQAAVLLKMQEALRLIEAAKGDQSSVSTATTSDVTSTAATLDSADAQVNEHGTSKERAPLKLEAIRQAVMIRRRLLCGRELTQRENVELNDWIESLRDDALDEKLSGVERDLRSAVKSSTLYINKYDGLATPTFSELAASDDADSLPGTLPRPPVVEPEKTGGHTLPPQVITAAARLISLTETERPTSAEHVMRRRDAGPRRAYEPGDDSPKPIFVFPSDLE